MTRYRILPYKQGSKGAKALASALNGKVLKIVGSAYSPAPTDVVINWGTTDLSTSTLGQWGGTLNKSLTIKNASNKLNFFTLMEAEGHDEIIPRFWTTRDQVPDNAFPVVCRTVLAGHSGAGIVIANTRSDLVAAPLYVQYVKKETEFRVHVGMKGGVASVISLQRKARRLDHPNPNWQVRNLAGGFIYARSDVNPPSGVIDVAKTALLASGLDFGAVDVIYNTEKARAYVLEINTAPGLEGTTVEDYRRFFTGEA